MELGTRGGLILLGLVSVLIGLPTALAMEDTRTISSGSYHGYDVTGESDSDRYLQIYFETQGRKLADLYIMNHTEYDKYLNGYDFDPLKSYERTDGVNTSWAQRIKKEEHYIVVDNKDNSRANDARPSGDLTYTLRYTIEDYKAGNDDMKWFGVFMISLFCILPIIIVVLFLYNSGRFLTNRRKTKQGEEPFPDQRTTEQASTGREPEPQPSAYRPRSYEEPSTTRAPPITAGGSSSYRAPPETRPEPMVTKTLRCGSCQAPVKADWKVCPRCETPVTPPQRRPTSCPDCGKPVEGDWKVCPACTAPLPDFGSRPTHCPGCQEPVEPDWKACPRCMHSLD